MSLSADPMSPFAERMSRSATQCPISPSECPVPQPNVPFRRPNVPFQQPNVPFRRPNVPFQQPNVPFRRPNIPFRSQQKTSTILKLYWSVTRLIHAMCTYRVVFSLGLLRNSPYHRFSHDNMHNLLLQLLVHDLVKIFSYHSSNLYLACLL